MASDLFMFLIAAAMVITKWIDSQTTLSRIREIGQEQNAWARKLMRKYGVGKAVYGIFMIHFSIVVISLILLYWSYDNSVSKYMYILIGIIVSVVQAAVAYANQRGRMNTISRFMLKCLHLLKDR
jgi:peptidoglycan/LPS O-acetylase OafA/YrhL